MVYTGFADEASNDLDDQIRATKELEWHHISLRTIGAQNIHELDQEKFEDVVRALEASKIVVSEFGTLIGNWSKSIYSSWKETEEEIKRCIPRMHRLGVDYARVMSYAQETWGEDQRRKERYKRTKEIVRLFKEEGLTALHENCMNYGGFSASHTLELLNEAPDLKLVFDTGNPIFQKDRSKTPPYPWQSTWEFYEQVKEAVVHFHIKDAVMEEDEVSYRYPGEGVGDVKRIIEDLINENYEGYLAIEPHMGKVFHDEFSDDNVQYQMSNYVEYGQKLSTLVEGVKSNL